MNRVRRRYLKEGEEPKSAIAVHLHWKFWRPMKDLIGDPVYIGLWVEFNSPTPNQSWQQYKIKKDMGLFV